MLAPSRVQEQPLRWLRGRIARQTNTVWQAGSGPGLIPSQPRRFDPELRICVVGAGCAGLTAAEMLKAKGYTDVTVLERADRPGGKAHSFRYQQRAYEYGAVMGDGSYAILEELMKLVGSRTEPIQEFADYHLGQGRRLPKRIWVAIKVLWEVWRYYAPEVRRTGIKRPGLANIDPELAQPFRQWAKAHNIETVAHLFERALTAYGYPNHGATLPAAYVLKYFDFDSGDPLKLLRRLHVYTWPNGIEDLWTKIASRHVVHYDAEVTSIRRRAADDEAGQDQPEITVTTATGATHTCNRLFLTSPLDEAVAIMDASAAEKSAFSGIKYEDYRTCAAVVEGLDKNFGYIRDNFAPGRAGHPMAWYNRFPEEDLYVFYVFGGKGPDGREITDDQIKRNICADVVRFGGRVVRWHGFRHWRYFPHFDSDRLREGAYDEIAAVQGHLGTYYGGELLQFSTIRATAEWSRHLIDTCF